MILEEDVAFDLFKLYYAQIVVMQEQHYRCQLTAMFAKLSLLVFACVSQIKQFIDSYLHVEQQPFMSICLVPCNINRFDTREVSVECLRYISKVTTRLETRPRPLIPKASSNSGWGVSITWTL